MNVTKTSKKKIHKKCKSYVDCAPKYSKVSESLRYVTSGSVQCSMFCGGRQCKYEGPEKWSEDEMAIKGLYSSWITNNILAMARPSTRNIKKFDMIQQFQRWGITAVINLQHPGEHANCGHGLENAGFSYDPQHFMDNGIFFYNFIWADYGVRSLESLLDMVKVMDFALQEGKISVHCHAGLGRTGVLIASYLIYSLRMNPEQAIHTVRKKRPKSVQTRGQISCVQDFSKFLKPLWIVFPTCYAFGVKRFTLEQYLVHQRHMLHGYEARELKYIPKIIMLACKRILDLCSLDCSKLHITNYRMTEKQEESIDKEDVYECDIKNVLNIENEPISHISASVEDLKGECDDMNAGYCLTNSELTNSQPSGLLSFKNNKLGLIKTHTKSDSELYESKDEVGKVVKFDDDTTVNYDDDDVFEMTRSQPNNHRIHIPSSTHNVHNEGSHMNCSIAAAAFASNEQNEDEIVSQVQTLQRVLNESNEGWDILQQETNVHVLTSLIFSWITSLTKPVLYSKDVRNLLESKEDPFLALLQLSRAQRGISECLLVTIFKLTNISNEVREKALINIITTLTHCNNTKSMSTETTTQHQHDIASSQLISDSLKYLLSLYERFIHDS